MVSIRRVSKRCIGNDICQFAAFRYTSEWSVLSVLPSIAYTDYVLCSMASYCSYLGLSNMISFFTSWFPYSILIYHKASLTCIDSLISQVPNLTSLNLSDCPNIRTLAPLATALEMQQDQSRNQQDHDVDGGPLHEPPIRRTLSLRHLWVRGCNLSRMSREEWSDVFDALAESSGPLERLTLSRNNMSFLHKGVGKLKRLTYLFIEDNNAGTSCGTMESNDEPRGSVSSSGFAIPDELGNLTSLRFISLCSNDVTALPRTMGRLNDNCDVYLHRNPNLKYPPPEYQRSIKTMRRFFHQERMALLRGAVLFMPHCKRARWRANERLYQPGGWGYEVCKERFEESVRRTSITLLSD